MLSIETSVLFHIGQTSLTKAGKVYAKPNTPEQLCQHLHNASQQKNTTKGKKIQQESVCLCTTADRLNELAQCQLEGMDHKLLQNHRLLDSIRKQVAH